MSRVFLSSIVGEQVRVEVFPHSEGKSSQRSRSQSSHDITKLFLEGRSEWDSSAIAEANSVAACNNALRGTLGVEHVVTTINVSEDTHRLASTREFQHTGAVGARCIPLIHGQGFVGVRVRACRCPDFFRPEP